MRWSVDLIIRSKITKTATDFARDDPSHTLRENWCTVELRAASIDVRLRGA